MSRLFDGIDDRMEYASPNPTGAVTLLVVARMIQADLTWASFLEMGAAGAGSFCAMGRKNDDRIYYSNQTTVVSPNVAMRIADGWMVAAVTKAAGTVFTRHHKAVIGGSQNHVDAGTTMADSSSSAGQPLYIGGDDDPAGIRLAAAAIWVGTVLTDAEIEGIRTAATTQSIADLNPTWLVDDSDAFATDLVGTNDRVALVGTADDADDPAGWVYGLGGGPEPATTVPQYAAQGARW